MQLYKLYDQFEQALEYIKKPFYIGSLVVVHLLYIFIFFGIIHYSGDLVQNINIGIQVFICLFLIFRFHPFRKPELRDFDANIIFGSAIFLLVNLGFTQYFIRYFDNTNKMISVITDKLVTNATTTSLSTTK